MVKMESVSEITILPNRTAKPVPETQKLAECIYDFIKEFGVRCYLMKKIENLIILL